MSVDDLWRFILAHLSIEGDATDTLWLRHDGIWRAHEGSLAQNVEITAGAIKIIVRVSKSCLQHQLSGMGHRRSANPIAAPLRQGVGISGDLAACRAKADIPN
jgi:hypothetical protein